MNLSDILATTEINKRPEERQDWRVEQFLEVGGYSIIIGEKGAGKTTFACGHVIPEAFKAGIQRVFYVTVNNETTVKDLQLYAKTYGYSGPVYHFGKSYSQRGVKQEKAPADSEYIYAREAIDEAGEHYIRNQQVFYKNNIIWLMKCFADDSIPTLWVAEGLPDLLPDRVTAANSIECTYYEDMAAVGQDILENPRDWNWQRYGGGDILQNTEQKAAIDRMLSVMGAKDSLLELTHTQKTKPDQIKGSTGRYDTARIAHFINKHEEAGVRWTTIRGDGNSNIKVSHERKLIVEDVPVAHLVSVFGPDYRDQRVPEQRLVAIEDKQPEGRKDLESLLDIQYPASTHEMLVALDMTGEDDETTNDARDWKKVLKRFERQGAVFSSVRGKNGNSWTLDNPNAVARMVGRYVPDNQQEETFIYEEETA